MINATSESNFLWRGLRSHLGFQLQCALAYLRNGHLVRKKAIDAYLGQHEERKLHLSATHEVPGFLNSQILGHVPINITRPLPLPDASFDLVYSSHLVEHIHRKQFHAFLADVLRVLKPGGQHIIATPSLRKIVDVAYGDDAEKQKMLFERGAPFYADGFHTPCHQINLTMRAFGHRFLYDAGYMQAIGERTGYTSIEVIPNDGLPDEALNTYIRERKPARWFVETETYRLEKAAD